MLPKANLCCGRPLYDWGMLDRAKHLLLQILDTLKSEIEQGIPIVVLEPSCAAVFRDELLNLFPKDDRARRLSQQTFLLSEFLEKKAAHFQLPKLTRKALVHGHCHHKSVMRMTDEESVLRKMGIDFQAPAPGCCGMAGVVRLRTRQIRNLGRDRRVGTPAGGSEGFARLSDHRRRLQLPRTDRAVYRPARPASGGSHSDGGTGRFGYNAPIAPDTSPGIRESLSY